MKVDFNIGTKGRASYFIARFIYIGRHNEDCNCLALVLVNSMQNLFDNASREAKITDEQMLKAKEVAETNPLHVILDISLIKGRMDCKVTYVPEKNPPETTPKQAMNAYKVAECLSEFIKDYARQARNGEAPHQYKAMNFIRDFPKWKLAEPVV